MKIIYLETETTSKLKKIDIDSVRTILTADILIISPAGLAKKMRKGNLSVYVRKERKRNR